MGDQFCRTSYVKELGSNRDVSALQALSRDATSFLPRVGQSLQMR